MSIFETLSPAEKARQLGNPEGEVGLAVAEWLNGNNRVSNARMIDSLNLSRGMRVLEIGPGNGRAAPHVVASAEDVHYTGIDLSPTMVTEADRFNADLVAAGRVAFRLGSAEQLPFPDASFDRIFSIGVIHFWPDPTRPLAETRRVLKAGGVALAACLAPRAGFDFSRPGFGFFLRDASEWDRLYRAAGFAEVKAEELETVMTQPDGTPVTRYSIRVVASA
jgi:ubiquinone/menaquinone biosynthesis C-methylase UbiE